MLGLVLLFALVRSLARAGQLNNLLPTQHDVMPAQDVAALLSGSGVQHGPHPWYEPFQTSTTDGPSSIVKLPAPFRQLTTGSTPAGWMQMGTPPKWIKVIFDTGSDKLVAKTWSSIESMLSNVDQGVQGLIMPTDLLYSHNASSTYVHKMTKNPLTGEEAPAISQLFYGSGDAFIEEGFDTVIVGKRSLENFSMSELLADSLKLLHTSKGYAGILGLQHMKNGTLGNSLFSEFRKRALMTSFGYCRGANNTGMFIWGDDSKEGTEIPVIGQMHWAVTLQNVMVEAIDTSRDSAAERRKQHHASHSAIRRGLGHRSHARASSSYAGVDVSGYPFDMGGQGDADHIADDEGGFDEGVNDEVRLGNEACSHRNCTAILDTGSNIIAGPKAAVKRIIKQLNVKNDCSNFDQLPPITLQLGGHPVTIHAESYVMKMELPPGGAGDGDSDGDGHGDGDGDSTGDGDGDNNGGADHDFGGDGDGSAHSNARRWGHSNAHWSGERSATSTLDDSIGREGASPLHRPRTIQIGLPGQHGRSTISISVNRREPELHASDRNVRRKAPGEPAALEQRSVRRSMQGSAARRWRALLSHMQKRRGIDLSTALRDLVTYANGTEARYLCMPAIVPVDKQTRHGPLWIVGTPFLDEYYGRYSFDLHAEAPTFSFKPLKEAKTCQDMVHSQHPPPAEQDTTVLRVADEQQRGAPLKQRLMRAESHQQPRLIEPEAVSSVVSGSRRGPALRQWHEITSPHWANRLLNI